MYFSLYFLHFQVFLVDVFITENNKISSPRPHRSPGRVESHWGSSRGSRCGRGSVPWGSGVTVEGSLVRERATCLPPLVGPKMCPHLVSVAACTGRRICAAREQNISLFPPKFFGCSTIKLIRDRFTFHMYRSPIKIWDPKGSQVVRASITSWLKEPARIWGCKEEGFSLGGRRDFWKIEVALLCR